MEASCCENMDTDCCEYVFATELVSSVMELYYVKWKPNKLPSNENQSLFSPVVKKAVEYIWKEKKDFIEDLFNTLSNSGTINTKNYKFAVEYATHLVTEAEFDEIELLRYCVIASGYASLFYLNGQKDVPNQCIKFIYNTIMSFRHKNQFTDESWHDIEILGEAYSVEPDFKDLSNSTSACFNEVNVHETSEKILHTEVYSKNVENKYPSKTFDQNSISPMLRDCTYLKEYSMENEKYSSKSQKHKNINSKFEKTKSNNKKSEDFKVVNELVPGKRTFLGKKITTQNRIKIKNLKEESVFKKCITLENEDKQEDKAILNSLNVKHVMSKTNKNTDKLKDTFNKYKEMSIKRSEAILQINNTVQMVNNIRGNAIISQIENTSENTNMIAYKTKKANIIKEENKDSVKQSNQESSKFYNTSEITGKKAKNTKLLGKNYKNKKYRFSKSKMFKANKNTSNAGVSKGITETNNKAEEIDYLSDDTQETNKTCTEAAETKNSVEDDLIFKDTNTDKNVKGIKIKSKQTKYNTKRDIIKTKNAASAIKQLSKDVKENHNVPVNSDGIHSENRESKCNLKVSKIKYVSEKIQKSRI